MDNTSKVANRGLIRPPLIYSLSFVAAWLVHWHFPQPLFSFSGAGMGLLLITIGVILFAWAVAVFRLANTAVAGNKVTTTIVNTGPFRFSRNPIYLAFTLMQIGASVYLNSLWCLFSIVFSFLVMTLVVIPREEKYLLSVFSEEYARYRLSVRRWL